MHESTWAPASDGCQAAPAAPPRRLLGWHRCGRICADGSWPTCPHTRSRTSNSRRHNSLTVGASCAALCQSGTRHACVTTPLPVTREREEKTTTSTVFCVDKSTVLFTEGGTTKGCTHTIASCAATVWRQIGLATSPLPVCRPRGRVRRAPVSQLWPHLPPGPQWSASTRHTVECCDVAAPLVASSTARTQPQAGESVPLPVPALEKSVVQPHCAHLASSAWAAATAVQRRRARCEVARADDSIASTPNHVGDAPLAALFEAPVQTLSVGCTDPRALALGI